MWQRPERLADWRTRWSTPCDEMFEYLEVYEPDALLAMVASGDLHPADLTYAAERLGRHPNGPRALAVLMPLLDHPKPYVREGVIYGIGGHPTPEVRTRLAQMATDDPSDAVRESARETLEWLDP